MAHKPCTFVLEEPLFGSCYAVIIGSKDYAIRALQDGDVTVSTKGEKRRKDITKKFIKKIEKGAGFLYDGAVIGVQKGEELFLLLHLLPPEQVGGYQRFASNVAHEAVHLANRKLPSLGIKMKSFSGQEVYAYYVGWVVKEVLNRYEIETEDEEGGITPSHRNINHQKL